MKKHEAIEADISSYHERIQVVVELALALAAEGYYDTKRISAQKDNVLRQWALLSELLRARRARLEQNLALQKIFQEMVYMIDWMEEMQVGAGRGGAGPAAGAARGAADPPAGGSAAGSAALQGRGEAPAGGGGPAAEARAAGGRHRRAERAGAGPQRRRPRVRRAGGYGGGTRGASGWGHREDLGAGAL